MLPRRHLLAVPALLLPLQGCGLSRGLDPAEEAKLSASVAPALPPGSTIRLVRRAEVGRGRTRVVGLYNAFEPMSASSHNPDYGVMVATDDTLFFLQEDRSSSGYRVAALWRYAEISDAELRMFGRGRWIVLRDGRGVPNAFQLMETSMVMDTAAIEAMHRIIQDGIARAQRRS